MIDTFVLETLPGKTENRIDLILGFNKFVFVNHIINLSFVICRRLNKRPQQNRQKLKRMRQPRQRTQQQLKRPCIPNWQKVRQIFLVIATSYSLDKKRETMTTTRKKCQSVAKDWSRWAKCKDQMHHQPARWHPRFAKSAR